MSARPRALLSTCIVFSSRFQDLTRPWCLVGERGTYETGAEVRGALVALERWLGAKGTRLEKGTETAIAPWRIP